MPCLRQTSAIFIPASCSRRTLMICSSVNRLRFIRPSPPQGRGLYSNLEEFSGLRSPELQMILYSSFGHTDKAPRYRVCIPSTHYVSPFVHEMLGRMIEHRLVQMGYGDEGSP